jgi:Rieske Fe-S protein
MDFKPAFKTFILAIGGMTFALAAFAQWQWIDKDGHKVFSDRSPPSDIQEKDILKRPGGASRTPVATPLDNTAAPVAGATAAPASKASAPRLSGKDTQLEAKKKQAEDAEAANKKVEEEKVTAAKTENCGRAKRGVASFDSGVRIATTNAKGEREIMDDKSRATETKRLQDIVASDCK